MAYDVTISIVNYNNYHKAKAAIKSILEQTQEVKYKIYLIDNYSSDDNATTLANEFSGVEFVLSDKNLGYGRANNLVLEEIDSRYHAIINPDIILKDDVFTKLTEFMDKNEDIGLLTPSIYFTNGDPQYLPKRRPKFIYLLANRLPFRRLQKYRDEYKMLDCDLSKVIDIQFASGCFMFCRTKLLKEIGGFDKRYFMYFEDADLTREFLKYTRVVLYPDAKVYHDYVRASAKRLKFLAIHVWSMFKYFIKWGKYERIQKKTEN